MSHGKERNKKNCLNCGSEVKGPFCHICGQQNLEPQESVWDLITHFVHDITHFEGKFFTAIKNLVFKPGFLSKEYLRGRKAAHMNPVRMYVFTSAFFFVVFFAFVNPENTLKIGKPIEDIEKERLSLVQKLQTVKDSAEYQRIVRDLRESDTTLLNMESIGLIEKSPLIADSVRKKILPAISENSKIMDFGFDLPNTIAEYDSIEKALPDHKKDGWLKKYFKKKLIEINKRYQNDASALKEKFTEKFLHSIPKMMFVSLPIVAFFLWLLYIRKKRFYYVHHAILVIHIYIAIYFIILSTYLLSWLHTLTQWVLFKWIIAFFIIYCFYYVYKSIRNFYEEKRGITILKYFIFLFMLVFLFAFLSVGFVINSLLQV